MPYAIFVLCVAHNLAPIDAYVMDFDVDANEGRGGTRLTRLPHRAMKFKSLADALAAYKKQSKVQPYRDDGEPNRPLTAFTVEIRRI